jgi:hypothetical protein
MFFPFDSAVMLALESNRVIGLRLTKLAAGGVEAFEEAHLIISEKIGAAAEATSSHDRWDHRRSDKSVSRACRSKRESPVSQIGSRLAGECCAAG